MSNIEISHAHSLPPAEARQAIQEVADKLTERFGLETHWEGEHLHFSGAGADGTIGLQAQQVVVKAQLGFLLSAMQGMVESEIQRVLSEKFG